MKSYTSLSIEDLDTLLTNQSVIKGTLLLKPASQRHICSVDVCPWQGTDNFELEDHVKIFHESDLEPEDYMLQIVISEDELQELAVQGVLVIEGRTFQVVQPVRFMYSTIGGRWCSDSNVLIYNRGTKGPAKEAEILKQLQDEKSKHVEAQAKKEQIIRSLEDANKLALSQIDQLKRELADAKTSLSSAQLCRDVVKVPFEEPESEKMGVGAACSVLEDLSSKLEISNAKLESQIGSVSEVLGKGILVWAEEQTRDKRIIEDQRKRIAGLSVQLSQKNILASDSIAIHKRFLIYAREGMIDRAKTVYQRTLEIGAIINRGNNVAHRANVVAHVTLYQGGQLSADDVVTFEKMYSLPLAKWESSLVSPRSVEMWNMMGTMAATLARIKFRSSYGYSQLYQDFLVLCEKTSSIRISIEQDKGIGGDAIKAFDEHDEVTSNLKTMKIIVDKFTQQDKAQRSSHED